MFINSGLSSTFPLRVSVTRSILYPYLFRSCHAAGSLGAHRSKILFSPALAAALICGSFSGAFCCPYPLSTTNNTIAKSKYLGLFNRTLKGFIKNVLIYPLSVYFKIDLFLRSHLIDTWQHVLHFHFISSARIYPWE